jgi:protoheme IX farnesyltransferase
MAPGPILIISVEETAADRQPWFAPWLAAAPDYWALTKPEVNFLIVICTLAGFYLGSPAYPEHFPLVRLIHTLLGTLLVASGTGTLNQYLERRFDALMRRTATRPLPAGRINPRHALAFGTLLASGGAAYLGVAVSVLASLLAILTLGTYLFAYTPLKRKTPICTLVGAFPGAIPPLIGWAAAAGTVSLQALAIYAVLFLWQFPHFMAIAWMYREDYARAGYLVLPCESQCRFLAWVTALPTLGLVILSLAPTPLARAGLVCRTGVLLLSCGLVFCGAQLGLCRSTVAARRLLLASIVYLPLVFALRMADRFLSSS